MPLEYIITYTALNTYENLVNEAHWQFLIIPEQNDNQEFVSIEFNNSLNSIHEFSTNGYGFKTIRIHPKQKFKEISFEASFKLIKKDVNPFDFEPQEDINTAHNHLEQLSFKIDHETFLKKTNYTSISATNKVDFKFNSTISLFDNLITLNKWISEYLQFKTDVTNSYTTLDAMLEKKQGVCQDFTHLFCAVARQNGIPTRYVSGYLHQGNGYFGDSQMHAWAEAFIPEIGWIGFDPTNNLLATTNHIKVAHGKDYNDCSPLRGVVCTSGKNQTKHTVKVASQQQQQ